MGNAHTKTVALLSILLACCACAFALDPTLDISQYAHTAWKVRDGFAKGIIYAIAQTPDGYVWLGTEVGLLRFDGVRAVPWQPPAGQHLPNTEVWRLLAARDGTLWIGTTSGLASWKDGKLLQYPELGDRAVDALFEDRGGTIWVGTSNFPKGRLCAFQGGKGECYGEDNTLGPVTCVYEDKAGNIWAGGDKGLWRWKPGPPKLYVMPGSASVDALIEGDHGELLIATSTGMKRLVGDKVEAHPLPDIGGQFKPNSTLRDRNGGLWIGTEDRGLVHVHQGRADGFTQADELSGNYVTNLFEDREHNIWISTLTGLDRFRNVTVPTISVKQGLSNNTVLSVLAARDGSVWFGTRDGLNRWKDGHITVYRKPDGAAKTEGASHQEHLNVREITDRGLPDNSVGSLGEDQQGRIWVSTNAGIGYFDNDRYIPIRDAPGGRVSGIAADGAGSVWISNQKHGLLHLVENHVVEQIPWERLGHKDFALTLFADPLDGGLWLGFFSNGGLVYWKNGQIASSFTVEALGGGSINDLQSDRDGTLWAATGHGLSRVNNGRVATLSSKNGLPCDSVHGMREDSSRSVWLYMACGLARMARTELDAWAADPNRTIQVTVFDGTEGVGTHDIQTPYSPRIAKSADGKIWFLPFDGVSFVDPQHIPFNNLPPPLHIEQVTAGRKTYNATNGLRLPAHSRDLQIDYTALSFVAPEKVRFRYKLEGLDSDWQDAGTRRQAFYTNLPPRSYRFRVIAGNNSGVWNEQGAALDFAIAPAYYQTNWFRALCVLTLLAMLWVAHRLRVRVLEQRQAILERHQAEIRALNEQMIKAQEAERMRISGELHDGVLQQITSVTLRLGKVRRQVPADSEATATVNGLQQQLINIGTDIRHLSHELHPSLLQESGLPGALCAYCEEFSKVRDLPVSCETDESVRELSPGAALCLYRIAQEALGNAAKYSKANKVEVRLTRSDGRVFLSVSDDGVGCTPADIAKSGGLGLINMRERVRQLNGTFEFDSKPAHGATVKVTVPFRPAS